MITRSNVLSWMHKQKWGLEKRPQVELGVQASVEYVLLYWVPLGGRVLDVGCPSVNVLL